MQHPVVNVYSGADATLMHSMGKFPLFNRCESRWENVRGNFISPEINQLLLVKLVCCRSIHTPGGFSYFVP